MKSVVGFLEYGFPVFRFLQNQACLRIQAGHFQHLL